MDEVLHEYPRPSGRPKAGKPNPIDIHVGGRLRLRRSLLGLSQEKLGEAIGLTFQQVQKYERGTNRIGASRLYDLSVVLDVPVSFFFDDLDDRTAGIAGLEPSMASDGGDTEAYPQLRSETQDLVRAFFRVDDPGIRKRLFELTKAVANAGSGDESGPGAATTLDGAAV